MSLFGALKGTGENGFGYNTTAEEVTEGLDLSGRTYLVTGCNSGLGAENLRVLVKRGAHVLGTARTEAKAQEACGPYGEAATPLVCELTDPASVRRCTAQVTESGRRLDALIANAGVMALPRVDLVHGLEKQFFANHVGHFMLVTGLLDRLTDRGRVVMLSSAAHKRPVRGGIDFNNLDGSGGYAPWPFYGQSKLANLLFARELATRLPEGQTANAVHPGVIHTNLGRHLPAPMRAVFGLARGVVLKDVPQGTATQCYVATHPDLDEVTGEYFADCNVAPSTDHGRDMALARRLWDETERIVARLPRGD